jgi:hypothetical protein
MLARGQQEEQKAENYLDTWSRYIERESGRKEDT